MIKILNFYSVKIFYKKEEKKQPEEQEEKAAAEDLSKSISGLAWEKDRTVITKALVGDEVTLCAHTQHSRWYKRNDKDCRKRCGRSRRRRYNT